MIIATGGTPGQSCGPALRADPVMRPTAPAPTQARAPMSTPSPVPATRLAALRAAARPLLGAFDRAARRPWVWALAGLAVGALAFAGWHAARDAAAPAPVAPGEAPAAAGAQAPGLGLPAPDATRREEVVGLDPTLAARPEDRPSASPDPMPMPPPVDNPELGGVDPQDAAQAASDRERWMPPKAERVSPRYPREALRRGEEGTVLLVVALDRSGFPRKVDVAASSRSRALDRAAMDAVRQWRFAPARPEEPDLRSLEVPVDFRMQ